MPDVHDPAARSRNMAAIRGSDTNPERLIRKGLHALGFRYRLHVRDLPGRPDLVFPKFSAVVFVHGCYWHGHDCSLFRLPQTRADFWKQKISANAVRDAKSEAALRDAGWRIGIIWECALKGPDRQSADAVPAAIANWLLGCKPDLCLASATAGPGRSPLLHL